MLRQPTKSTLKNEVLTNKKKKRVFICICMCADKRWGERGHQPKTHHLMMKMENMILN